MLKRYTGAVFAVVLCCSPAAYAGEVATWIDNNGVTHFGNPQFAPPGEAQAVVVKPANGMDVVATNNNRRAGSSGPRVSILERNRVENPRGFRGYQGREVGGRAGRRRY
ncbi:MAG: DUF4124 domain-containing protein [Pseudomonadales bacterium]|jgi:hypothetical protein|nr:DUF4124 domain-containing protein [Pseudomonadales bacterium]